MATMASILRAEPPLILELAGPAGAGKTTLRRELLARDPTIELVGLLPRPQLAASYLRRVVPLVPSYVTRYRGTRWFTRLEGKAIGLLDGWQRQVDAGTGRTLLMDQGAVFRLAVLSELGPPIAQSERFRRVVTGWTEAWGRRLGVVVWVSAPGSILLQRIRTRPQDHAVKQWAAGPALERVHRYEAAIDRVIRRMAARDSIVVVRFDTAVQDPSSMAEEVLSIVARQRATRG